MNSSEIHELHEVTVYFFQSYALPLTELSRQFESPKRSSREQPAGIPIVAPICSRARPTTRPLQASTRASIIAEQSARFLGVAREPGRARGSTPRPGICITGPGARHRQRKDGACSENFLARFFAHARGMRYFAMLNI